jgi:hypothetical protein
MNRAIEQTSAEFNIGVKEFTVAGVPDGKLFSHHWFIGTDDPVDATALKERIDACLNELNDDYAVERKFALKNIKLDVLPTEVFYDWLRSQGKEGGQTKFPRVLKKEKLESWLAFVGSKA